MITKEMSLSEVVMENPQAGSILMSFGIGVGGNTGDYSETLQDLANERGIELDSLIASLNVVKFF